jgi:hypothetical protein
MNDAERNALLAFLGHRVERPSRRARSNHGVL